MPNTGAALVESGGERPTLARSLCCFSIWTPATAPQCSFCYAISEYVSRPLLLNGLLVEIDKLWKETANCLAELIIADVAMNWISQEVQSLQ